MPSLLHGKLLTPMLLMMLVSLLMQALPLLMLLLVMFGMLDLPPTLGLLIPGPQVLLFMEDILMVMLVTTMDKPHQLTVTQMPTTDGEKNKQSETNPKNLIVILCSLT
mgnify:CR=1 FL=1